jgi:hypothetical protein
MRKKFFVLSMLIFLSILVTVLSCNKDSLSNKTDEQISMRDSRISKSQIYDIRKAFAKTLIIAMREEPALRSFLKNKCIIADTSNYELVYLSLKDNAVTRGLTFSQILASHAPEDVLQAFGANFFNQLVNDVPLLTISFPDMDNVHLSDWNTNTIPDVAAVSTINLKSFTLYSSENNSKNELTLNDGQIEEDVISRPILAVYDAENHYLVNFEGFTFEGISINSYMPGMRGDDPPSSIYDCWHFYLESQQAIASYIFTNEGIRQQYYLAEHNKLIKKYMECLNLFGVTFFTTDLENPCQRDHEIQDEHIVDFKINGWTTYTHIKNQAFEDKFVFHGDVLALTRNSMGVVSSYNVKYVSGTLKKEDLLDCSPHPCSGKWVNANYRFWTDWKKDSFGSPYLVKWAEVDGGSAAINMGQTITSSFTYEGATFAETKTIGYSYKGDPIVDLGSAPVIYCDPIMMENSTGSLTFRVD